MTIAKRDNKLDYLKALAIGLVIWGHILDNCVQGDADYHLRGIICFVHIPLFLVISGTLVKGKPLNAAFFKNILKRFVLPYTVWTILLTTFYQGTTHLLYDGLLRNIEVYCSNWTHSFLWFIKAYVIVYLLWSVLYKLSLGFRMLVGSLILFLLNIVFISHDILSELLSLSLYSYVFFASGAFLRSYFPRLKKIHLSCILFLFLIVLPYATISNSYFNASFRALYESGNWYIFLVRFVAGLAISIFLINIDASKYNLHIGGVKTLFCV